MQMMSYQIIPKSYKITNVSTERLKWRLMVRQNAGKHVTKTMHVSITSDAHTIQSFEVYKWRCALWRYVTSRLLSCNFRRNFRWSDKKVVDMLIDNVMLNKCSMVMKWRVSGHQTNNYVHLAVIFSPVCVSFSYWFLQFRFRVGIMLE